MECLEIKRAGALWMVKQDGTASYHTSLEEAFESVAGTLPNQAEYDRGYAEGYNDGMAES